MDEFTLEHSKRTQYFAEKLAEHLGLSEEKKIFLSNAAFKHDIGKIHVDKEILYKNGKLTDKEFKIMKLHTTEGYKDCMTDPELKPYADVVRHHHEKLDGSGYPDGLKGNEISFEARFIGAVDIYEAMSADRPYKSVVEHQEIKEIMIKECNNNKLDPQIVKPLLEVAENDIYKRIIEQYKSELPEIKNISRETAIKIHDSNIRNRNNIILDLKQKYPDIKTQDDYRIKQIKLYNLSTREVNNIITEAVRKQITEEYKEEPAIKYISQNNVLAIKEINEKYGRNLSIKEMKELRQKIGKEIEKLSS